MDTRKVHVLLAGSNLARLVEISATLDPMKAAHVLAHTNSPLEYTGSPSSYRPEAVILELSGTETVNEFSELLLRHLSACFVFLVEQMPPSAAVAKAVGHRGVFLDKEESPLAISATLVSILYQRSNDGDSHERRQPRP